MITEQELAEIRKRVRDCNGWEEAGYLLTQCDDEKAIAERLLDEIDRLRTSDKTLREQVRQLEQSCDTIRSTVHADCIPIIRGCEYCALAGEHSPHCPNRAKRISLRA